MADLKLVALDQGDLSVISAHMQDAVMRVGDIAYIPAEKRFAALANRFDWEKSLGSRPLRRGEQRNERRRTGLRFERVLGAQLQGIDLTDRKSTLALLAITFDPCRNSDEPGGDVTLTFSGGAAIRLNVECLEAEMKDLGAVWATKIAPGHADDL